MSNVKLVVSNDWKKEWAGGWSFFTGSMLSRGYVNYFNTTLGFGPKQVLLITHKHYTTCYITIQDKNDFGNNLAKLFISHTTLAKKWSDDLIQASDTIMDVFDTIDEQGFTKENFISFVNGMHAYALAHWIVKSVVNFIQPDILENYMSDFTNARIYSEPVFDRLEKVIASAFTKITVQKNTTVENLYAMTKEEFESLLFDDVLVNAVDRFNQQGTMVTLDEAYALTASDIDEITSEWNKNNESNIIRGTVGNKGLVTGVARIINDPHNYHTFNEGEILVSSMTRPEFVPLMQKAAAIITDGGGILCHAAIVARELNIPCVIGTENATRIIKDGSSVEVNANNGIISIL